MHGDRWMEGLDLIGAVERLDLVEHGDGDFDRSCRIRPTA
jgi:hypothetical protein